MISIIIPTLNEEKCIEQTLNNVKSQQGDFEIIVSDGGSKDNTIRIAERYAKVVTSKRGRGPQMNAGAERAKGDILLFLHADTLLPKAGLLEVKTVMRDPSCIAGGFNRSFDSDRRVFRYRTLKTSIWFWFTKAIAGDQAMFVKKNVFDKVGGFKEIPIMEDIEISKRLRKKGMLCLLDKSITTSARRFQKGGVLKTMAIMFLCYTLFHIGMDPRRIKRIYEDIR